MTALSCFTSWLASRRVSHHSSPKVELRLEDHVALVARVDLGMEVGQQVALQLEHRDAVAMFFQHAQLPRQPP